MRSIAFEIAAGLFCYTYGASLYRNTVTDYLILMWSSNLEILLDGFNIFTISFLIYTKNQSGLNRLEKEFINNPHQIPKPKSLDLEMIHIMTVS